MNASISGIAVRPDVGILPLLGRPVAAPSIHRYYHPEAVDWEDRVVANGGSVSHWTMAAVSQFCRDIDAAGLRERFFRLNLVCGSGLASAVVPLYRGPSLSESSFGYATDTNFNFVSADYQEYGPNGGIYGGVSSKWLQTGLASNTFFSRFNGVSFGAVVAQRGGNFSNYVIGANYSGQTNTSFFRNNEMQSIYATFSIANSAPFRDRVFMNTVAGRFAGNYVCVGGVNGLSFGVPTAGTAGFLAVCGQATSDTTISTPMFNGTLIMYSIGGLLQQHMTHSMNLICRSFMAAMGRIP